MQILQEVQKNLCVMGFSPELKPFNDRVLSILIISFPAVLSQFHFIIHEANNAQKYMESFYIISVCMSDFLCFTNTILNSTKIFSYIKSSVEFVNESKWNFNNL